MKRQILKTAAIALVFALAFIGAPMIALAQVSIDVWDQQPDNPTGMGKFMVQLQQEFDQTHPNIKVTHSTWPAGDWQQAIATQVASKTGATIIRGVLNSSIAVGFGIKGYLLDLALRQRVGRLEDGLRHSQGRRDPGEDHARLLHP
jgi:ABC-type glycerol-3-phosphate transport system substrate-binding protein